MTSPGTILMAKMLVPETEVPATEGKVVIPKDELHKDENLIGAIARGTIDGGKLAMNVAIMLISFSGAGGAARQPAGLDARPGLHALGSRLARPDSRLRLRARGVAHRRSLARLHGHRQPAGHAHGAQRSHRLHRARRAKSHAAPRSFTIATFALCGFANLGSIGMQIGGIGALVPSAATTWPS
jgi:concentrative nucleoside transporter, CNT family